MTGLGQVGVNGLRQAGHNRLRKNKGRFTGTRRAGQNKRGVSGNRREDLGDRRGTLGDQRLGPGDRRRREGDPNDRQRLQTPGWEQVVEALRGWMDVPRLPTVQAESVAHPLLADLRGQLHGLVFPLWPG